MEHYKAQVIDTAAVRPSCQFRYVDDTFVIWPHSSRNLCSFLHYLKQHPSKHLVHSAGGYLPFLDIDIYRVIKGPWATKFSGN